MKYIRKVQGEWLVQAVAYKNTAQKNITLPDSVSIYFDDCSKNENRNGQNCNLYLLTPSETINMEYTVQYGRQNTSIINIYYPYNEAKDPNLQQLANVLPGTYLFESLEDDYLELDMQFCFGDCEGEVVLSVVK